MELVERRPTRLRILITSQSWSLEAHAGFAFEHLCCARKDCRDRVEVPTRSRAVSDNEFAECDAHVEQDVASGILACPGRLISEIGVRRIAVWFCFQQQPGVFVAPT